MVINIGECHQSKYLTLFYILFHTARPSYREIDLISSSYIRAAPFYNANVCPLNCLPYWEEKKKIQVKSILCSFSTKIKSFCKTSTYRAHRVTFIQNEKKTKKNLPNFRTFHPLIFVVWKTKIQFLPVTCNFLTSSYPAFKCYVFPFFFFVCVHVIQTTRRNCFISLQRTSQFASLTFLSERYVPNTRRQTVHVVLWPTSHATFTSCSQSPRNNDVFCDTRLPSSKTSRERSFHISQSRATSHIAFAVSIIWPMFAHSREPRPRVWPRPRRSNLRSFFRKIHRRPSACIARFHCYIDVSISRISINIFVVMGPFRIHEAHFIKFINIYVLNT